MIPIRGWESSTIKCLDNGSDPSSAIRDRIVAADALGLGIDVSDIRVVIHVGVA